MNDFDLEEQAAILEVQDPSFDRDVDIEYAKSNNIDNLAQAHMRRMGIAPSVPEPENDLTEEIRQGLDNISRPYGKKSTGDVTKDNINDKLEEIFG